MQPGLKEASETDDWLQLSVQSRLLGGESVATLLKEIEELIRILNSIVKRTQHADADQ
jgi:four helix bundle protein